MTPEQYGLRAVDLRTEIAKAKTECEARTRTCRLAQASVKVSRERLAELRSKLRALKREWAQADGDYTGRDDP